MTLRESAKLINAFLADLPIERNSRAVITTPVRIPMTLPIETIDLEDLDAILRTRGELRGFEPVRSYPAADDAACGLVRVVRNPTQENLVTVELRPKFTRV